MNKKTKSRWQKPNSKEIVKTSRNNWRHERKKKRWTRKSKKSWTVPQVTYGGRVKWEVLRGQGCTNLASISDKRWKKKVVPRLYHGWCRLVHEKFPIFVPSTFCYFGILPRNTGAAVLLFSSYFFFAVSLVCYVACFIPLSSSLLRSILVPCGWHCMAKNHLAVFAMCRCVSLFRILWPQSLRSLRRGPRHRDWVWWM